MKSAKTDRRVEFCSGSRRAMAIDMRDQGVVSNEGYSRSKGASDHGEERYEGGGVVVGLTTNDGGGGDAVERISLG
eukprot:scaffold378_cov270-Chaetoceros_neogracile.AAC.6